MANLSYSAGVQVIGKFHRRKVIYVEGQDDKLFWKALFDEQKITGFHFKIAGGLAIDQYVAKVVQKNAQIWIAKDRDYSELYGALPVHQNILYTFGHSIENSLYCADFIARQLELHSRTVGNYLRRVEQWMKRTSSRLRRVIVLEAVNLMCGSGHKILGTSCERFAGSNKYEIDSKVVMQYCKRFNGQFRRNDIAAVKDAMKSSGKTEWWFVRGHFAANAAALFIRSEASRIGNRKVSISADVLFANALESFLQKCPRNPDVAYYRKLMRRLKRSWLQK